MEDNISVGLEEREEEEAELLDGSVLSEYRDSSREGSLLHGSGSDEGYNYSGEDDDDPFAS